jgi:catechol-2,3-dioxygenase
MTVPPVRLNHAVLFVTDLDRSHTFYTDLFAMETVTRDEVTRTAFLRLPGSSNHHDLGLFEVETPDDRQQNVVGLYHLAWQVDTVDELAGFREHLVQRGRFAGESDHGATLSVYGSDPDGNDFEIMWMLPRAHWGEFADTAPSNRLDLASHLSHWSGVRTAAEL